MAWHRLTIDSASLRGNALGDPHERVLHVWTPADGSRRYPSVYVIQGFTGTVGSWFNVEPWRESFPAAIERLEPPAVVVLVDAFTALGGSQFLDSPAIGDYHTYLCDEVVPLVDERFPTLPDAAHRGIQGKSSGGYGAMITPFLRPDLFGGLATHAGDALFEACYARDFAPAARALGQTYDGSYEAFWADFRSGRQPLSRPTDHVLLETYAMAAAYSPRPDGSVELPFDVETAELVPEVWERWLGWDPVRVARSPEHVATVRGLRAVWVDAGSRDEFHLDLGAAAFRRALLEAGLPAERLVFELFDAGHFGIGWRYPLALTWLVERLAASG